MPSSFEASASDVLDATKVLRNLTTHIDEVVQRYLDGVNQTMTWFGTGDDDFAKKAGPPYKNTVKNVTKGMLAFTEALSALADGTVKNANEYVNQQDDVLSSIKKGNDGRSGPRG
ncbi:hypothetical protein ACFRAO_08720 [Streptomyces sp. NPDC056656]|uniref:hypothetical protein n=1 Tax=Streptomyces sp. NPDC056656 TaxID=3345895 RepID=UPI0036940DA4